MKRDDFKDNELWYFQGWVIGDTKGSDACAFKDIEEKGGEREVAVDYDAREMPMHATTCEDINNILADGYEVEDW